MTKRKDPLLILVAKESDGYTYRLHPLQQERVQAANPNQKHSPKIFLSQDVHENFKEAHGPIAGHLVALLTGLTLEQAQELGGVRFVKSGSEQVLLTVS
jgi:hypothetical protein